MFYLIEPEVAGGLGDSTVMDNNFHPPVVRRLEYRFEGWLGDELLESFPCFIVSESLAEKLIDSNLTGVTFAPVSVTKSEEFRELHPHVSLPKFLWLKVEGSAGNDDFGVSVDHRLVVSYAAMDVLSTARLENADIEKHQ